MSLKAFSVYAMLLWPLKTLNPISWWDNAKPTFPSLHLYAFDILAIIAMSAECERVCSSTKKLITSERNRLAEEIIEASACLKNWRGRGLIQQLEEEEAIWGTGEVVEACGNSVCILHSHYCKQFY